MILHGLGDSNTPYGLSCPQQYDSESASWEMLYPEMCQNPYPGMQNQVCSPDPSEYPALPSGQPCGWWWSDNTGLHAYPIEGPLYGNIKGGVNWGWSDLPGAPGILTRLGMPQMQYETALVQNPAEVEDYWAYVQANAPIDTTDGAWTDLFTAIAMGAAIYGFVAGGAALTDFIENGIAPSITSSVSQTVVNQAVQGSLTVANDANVVVTPYIDTSVLSSQITPLSAEVATAGSQAANIVQDLNDTNIVTPADVQITPLADNSVLASQITPLEAGAAASTAIQQAAQTAAKTAATTAGTSAVTQAVEKAAGAAAATVIASVLTPGRINPATGLPYPANYINPLTGQPILSNSGLQGMLPYLLIGGAALLLMSK